MTSIQNKDLAGDVLAYLQENPGKRFVSNQLARTFKVAAPEMKRTLTAMAGQIDMLVSGKNRMYFVKTEAEKAEELRHSDELTRIAMHTHAAPYQLPPAMRAARERAGELYPAGGNFKSVS